MSDPDEFYIPDDGDPWQQQMEELEEQSNTPADPLKPVDDIPVPPGKGLDQRPLHSDGNPF
jgi:hypothetical protein